MSKSNSSKPDVFFLKSRDTFIHFISSSNEFKKTNEEKIIKNFNKWNKKYLVFDTNDFLLLPLELPSYLKKLNIEKTLGIEKNSKKRTVKISNLKLTYFYNPIINISTSTKISHISEVLINEFSDIKNKSKETYIVFTNKMLHISIIDKGKIVFYNQFNYSNESYIKYIILAFEEFKLDRKKSKINIIESYESFIKTKNKMKKYFKNINLYKKSIFEIIEDHYE